MSTENPCTPSSILTELRDLLSGAAGAGRDASGHWYNQRDAARAADLMVALDQWVSAGGTLPFTWANPPSGRWTWETSIGAYEVDHASDTIVSPGKFEGCPRYAVDFWIAVLDGQCDDERHEEGHPRVAIFEVSRTVEVAKYPMLIQVSRVEVWEDDNGFVHCRTVA